MTENAALVLAADDAYFPFACIVAKQAIGMAGKPLPAIVIHDRVSEKNLALGRDYCPQIVFADASHLLDGKNFETGWLSRAAYLRLFMDKIEELDPYHRVIYTDCDVSVLADLWNLLSIDLKSAPIAAAYDLRYLADTFYRKRLPVFAGAPYFNSGVVLFDLAAIRAGGELEAARTFATEHRDLCLAHDQDALNVVFQGKWQVMDWRWNAVSLNADLFDKPPFIRHFTGKKPWHPDKRGVEPEFIESWRVAIGSSPWPDRYSPQRSLTDHLKYRLYPAAQTAERMAKGLFFSHATTVRGNRARLLGRFSAVMARIEQAAAEGRLAEKFPETALLA
jgi:lipopolysaccharide biosynthesis glycosyltransferase